MSYSNLIKEKIKINIAYFLSSSKDGLESEVLIDRVYGNVEECKGEEWRIEIENAITEMISQEKIDFNGKNNKLTLIENAFSDAELILIEGFVNAKTL